MIAVILPRIGAQPLLALVVFGIIGYLAGSLPFAIWVTRLVRDVDVRDAGSHHATTTNTIRQAGFVPGLLVFLLDIAKGFIPVRIAFASAAPDWVAGAVAAAVVAGHCWPIFAGFRGGMGLASAGGAYLANSVLGFLITLAVLIALTLVIRHSARAGFVIGLVAAPILMLFELPAGVIWVAFLSGLVIVLRFTVDWRREFSALWLDREQP